MVDKIGWIHIRDRRVLGARSRGKEAIYLPGGKREPAESDEQCLVREISEELTVSLAPATIRPVAVFEAQAHGKPEGVMVRLACYRAEYEGELQASAEIAEILWLTSADRERCSPVVQQILDYLVAHGEID